MNNKNNNMKLQDYLDKHNKLRAMEEKVDAWAIEYQLEKLLPLIKAGYNFQDIIDFFAIKLNDFVHNGKLDELLEQDKQKGEK